MAAHDIIMGAAGASGPATYIEDVFSTWLYTGVSSGQMNIANGIDLAGKGGAIWIKSRGSSSYDNYLFSTATGGANAANSYLRTNTTAALDSTALNAAFTSTGFRLDPNNGMSYDGAGYGTPYTSWTFRKQPKFFDVVTWTGNGVDGRYINHALTSTPGAVFIKRTDTTSNWVALCRTNTGQAYLRLNSTAAADSSSGGINTNGYCGYVDDTTFAVYAGATDISAVNATGGTYVAYLFAHNAGGFGLTGTDNVISCGGFTVSGGATTTVNLGYEPQWVLIKRVDTTGNWELFDSMRGFTVDFNNSAKLFPNLADAESAPGGSARVAVTSTGFKYNPAAAADQMIYIAIRRGPMKTPTSGTSVFKPVTQTSDGTVSTGFPVDLTILTGRDTTYSYSRSVIDRLRGSQLNTFNVLATNSTGAESTGTGNGMALDSNVAVTDNWLPPSVSAVYWNFRRAPGFFDEVCYTGTGVSGLVVNHNLGVTPELLIYKNRATAGTNWFVLDSNSNYGNLNNNNAFSGPLSISLGPTSYTINTTGTSTNASGQTYVAYLFASCPGVSKVGSYTGTASTQTISCGFAARFVLIKRTDSTGDWFVWDTARGMVAGTDPRLALNSTAAEVNNNWVYTDAAGFQIVTTDATVNASGGSYIFLAIS